MFVLHSLFALKDDHEPIRKLHRRTAGFYSSLELAEAAMPEERNKNERPDDPVYLYCFIVKEFPMDVMNHGSIREWLYSPDGEPLDYRQESGTFKGRIEEEIRFKVGDIVDVIHYKGGKLVAEPMTVGRVPFTPNDIKMLESEQGKLIDPEEEYCCLPLKGLFYEYVSPVMVITLTQNLDEDYERELREYAEKAKEGGVRLRRRW